MQRTHKSHTEKADLIMIIADKKKNIFIDKARATKKKRFTTEVHRDRTECTEKEIIYG